MDVCKEIMALTSLPKGTSTSPGGILLPSSEDVSTIVLPNDKQMEDKMAIALAIPVDVSLWQTAIDLVMTDAIR